MLLNNPGNQSDCHISVLVNPGDNEADLILLPGSAVIITAVGDGVDALDVCLYGNMVDILRFEAQDTDQNLIPHKEHLVGIVQAFDDKVNFTPKHIADDFILPLIPPLHVGKDGGELSAQHGDR